MYWGGQFWVYLATAGLAGGAYFAGFLVNVFTGWKHRTFFRVATVTAVPFGIVGVLALLLDINALRVWHLFVSFKPEAMISIATWILTIWLTVCFIMFLAWLLEWDAKNNPDKYSYNMEGGMSKISKVLAWIGLSFQSFCLDIQASFLLIPACLSGPPQHYFPLCFLYLQYLPVLRFWLYVSVNYFKN
jgi:Ni/Fe-hydrogenase subunit HybB-like protein